MLLCNRGGIRCAGVHALAWLPCGLCHRRCPCVCSRSAALGSCPEWYDEWMACSSHGWIVAGSGRAALSLLRAYPEAQVRLVDMDSRRTCIAVAHAGKPRACVLSFFLFCVFLRFLLLLLLFVVVVVGTVPAGCAARMHVLHMAEG
eukprot:COSAG01_NODE_5518_length_4207_cov_14.979796_4_plen_146_part_00